MGMTPYLPDELWLKIVSDLDFRGLASLARLNRQLYRVTNDRLWRSFGDSKGAVDFAATHPSIDILKLAAHYDLWRHYDFERPLRQACSLGHTEIVAWLLDDNAQVNIHPFLMRDTEILAVQAYYSALYAALKNGHEEVALMLLSRCAVHHFTIRISGSQDIEPPYWFAFTTALHLAAANNLPQVVDYLLQTRRMSVDQQDSQGRTPLYYTIEKNGQASMLEKLIKHGADIDATPITKYNRYPGPLCAALKIGRYDLATILLDAGARVDDGAGGQSDCPYIPIHRCVYNMRNDDNEEHFAQQCAMLSRLNEAGANFEPKMKWMYGMHNVLGTALSHGSAAMVSHILDLGVRLDAPIPEVIPHDYPNPLDGVLEYDELEKLLQKLSILIRAGVKIDKDWNNGRGIGCAYSANLLDWAIGSCQTAPSRLPILEHLLAEGTACPDYLTFLIKENFGRDKIEECQLLLDHGATSEVPIKDVCDAAWWVVRERWDHMCEAAEWGAVQRWDFRDFASDRTLELRKLQILCNLGLTTETMADMVPDALRFEDEPCTCFLFDHGALAFAGQQPDWIQQATRWGNIVVLKRLLKEGADLNGCGDS
ncbi:ankyrin repeat-containing domain protein [Hypomontagnella monticulosa]|nr:ankyrin repeat-containing domain protein [Hypomontagnella monticulosa]